MITLEDTAASCPICKHIVERIGLRYPLGSWPSAELVGCVEYAITKPSTEVPADMAL